MRFFISAGEESGEIYGARLIREIRKLEPWAEFSGIGGDRMAAERMKLLYNCRDLSAIGLVDILKKIFFFKKVLKNIGKTLQNEHFDAVILIDAPELNFRIGKKAHAAGMPVFYYVCPQLWAWRTYRVNSVRKWVDTMMVIFPFEEVFYKKHRVRVKFVGHPLLDEIGPPGERETLKEELMPFDTKKLIGLMPGSRRAELSHILKPLIETADLIHAKRADTGFVIPVAVNLNEYEVKKIAGGRDFIKIIKGKSHKVMAANDLLITKSGTSTLEAALIGSPMIIVYKSSPISFWFAKLLANVDYAGLPNLIAGKEIATEYLQNRFNPEAVANEAVELLASWKKLQEKKKEIEAVRKSLGEKGTAGRAAKYILGRLKELTG